jgi:DNA polymerase-3 subunit epsilon
MPASRSNPPNDLPLIEVTFCVLDIETTGGSAKSDQITEIAVVKVRGGEIQGQFQTLVNPGIEIPLMIESLTGINTAMVQSAPKISEVLPSFFEFVRGSVLVAHNASFDLSFLQFSAQEHGYDWEVGHVVDTLSLARLAIDREEVRNKKLATLAQLFETNNQPSHRAMSDAQTTVEVLHALLERLATMGILHLTDLLIATGKSKSRRT